MGKILIMKSLLEKKDQKRYLIDMLARRKWRSEPSYGRVSLLH